MPKIVIADTSFLIAIQKLQLFSQIQSLYKEIYVTPTIANEFKLKLPDWIIIREPDNLQVAKVLSIVLDTGEASALALAYNFSDTVLILDDLKARKEAHKLGFKITGTLSVLYRLQQEGIIDSLKNQLNQLTELGFRISPKIIEEILKRGARMKPNIIPHRHYKEQSKNKIYKRNQLRRSNLKPTQLSIMRLLRRQRVIAMHMENYRCLNNHYCAEAICHLGDCFGTCRFISQKKFITCLAMRVK